MAHPHHCLVTQKLQSTYFNVLYAYFIIGHNVRSHCDVDHFDHIDFVLGWYIIVASSLTTERENSGVLSSVVLMAVCYHTMGN